MKKAPLEKEIQRDIVIALRKLGCSAYSLSQGFRPGGKRHGTTRQTKGLPDLYVFPPQDRRPFWIEVKRPGGTQSPEQVAFHDRCRHTAIGYVVGGLPDVLEYLRGIGVIAGDHAS